MSGRDEATLQIGRVDWVHRTVEREDVDELERVDAGEGGGEIWGAGSGDHRLKRLLHVAREESRYDEMQREWELESHRKRIVS